MEYLISAIRASMILAITFIMFDLVGGLILDENAAEQNYQQEALNNGLAITVVEMKQTGKYSAKNIADILDINTKDVYDILETEEAVR